MRTNYYEMGSSLIPHTSDNYVGIEIEFLSPYYQNEIRKFAFNSPIESYVSIIDDNSVCEFEEDDNRACHGTLSCGCHCEECHDYNKCKKIIEELNGHEMRVLVKQKDLTKVMSMVGTFLKRIKATVNKTCGLHVHIDMRNRDAKLSYKRLYNAQDSLFKLVAKHRKRNSYCNKATINDLDQAKTHWQRRAINARAMEEHNTIEVRLHQGSVDVKDITRWVELLCVIVDTPIEHKVSTPSTLAKVIKANALMKRYIENKRKKAA